MGVYLVYLKIEYVLSAVDGVTVVVDPLLFGLHLEKDRSCSMSINKYKVLLISIDM